MHLRHLLQLRQVDRLLAFRPLVHDDEVGGIGQQLVLQRKRKPRLGVGRFDALRARHPRQRLARIDCRGQRCARHQRLASPEGTRRIATSPVGAAANPAKT